MNFFTAATRLLSLLDMLSIDTTTMLATKKLVQQVGEGRIPHTPWKLVQQVGRGGFRPPPLEVPQIDIWCVLSIDTLFMDTNNSGIAFKQPVYA